MNEQRIAVICDTGTDTPADFVRAHDIRVVPLRINYSDGSSFESGVDITSAEVVSRFDQEIPTTSLPSPERLMDTLRRVRADGYASAVIVTISSGLSATFETASMVARQVAEDFPVTVVDTKSIGLAAGMVVMEAARLIEQGVPFARLADALEAVAQKTRVFFSVQKLDFLRKGGRISEAVYRVGSVLNIKPVLTCNDEGRYVIAKKARGWQRALDTEVRLAEEQARRWPQVRLGICCFENEALFEQLEDALRRQIDNVTEVVRSSVSPDLLVHTGPTLVGVAVQGL